MASNWWDDWGKSAVGGAASGALTGFVSSGFNPLGALAGGIGGGLMGGFSGSGEAEEIMPSLINADQYGSALNLAQGMYNNNTDLMRQMMGRSGTYSDMASNLLNQYTSSPDVAYNYDPTQANKTFLSMTPQLQNLVRESIPDYSNEDLLRQERDMIMSQVSDTFGGNPNSGAFVGAATQALANPLLQRAQAQQQMQANLLGSLYGQTLGGLQQGYSQQAGGELEAALANRNALLQAMQSYGSLGQLAQSGASMYGQLAGQGMNMMGNLSQPVYATPDHVLNPNPVANAMGTGSQFGALMGEVDWDDLFSQDSPAGQRS